MTHLMPSATPVRTFEDHEESVSAVAVSSDKRRMVTCSGRMLCLWDLRKGIVLNKTQGHSNALSALAISRDGQVIASGDRGGGLMTWDGDTGEPLHVVDSTRTNYCLQSLDFSPDGTVLAGGPSYYTMLWSTETCQQQGSSINCGTTVCCVRYSPSGEHLAIATDQNIQIYNPGTRSCIANFKGHSTINGGAYNSSLVWTPDGTRLFSAGGGANPTIQEWDSSTWKQVGDPWRGHFKSICAMSLNSDGTLLASASDDNRVRLWRVSDQRTIAVFRHTGEVYCVTFSADDRHILSGGADKKISEWPVLSEPDDALPQPEDGLTLKELATHQAKPPASSDFKARGYSDFKVLAINSSARYWCINGNLDEAERVLSGEIEADANNYTSYANRAFVRARRSDWDHALHDAMKSVSIQPSFVGHISQGIALCGKGQASAAKIAFEFASMYTNGDLKTSHFLFLIKTIAQFSPNEHEEAMLRLEELAMHPNTDPIACRIVEAYLRLQLGKSALDSSCYNDAVDHFTAAVNASAFFYKLDVHSMYEEFVVLFGWDLKSLWETVNKQHCRALLQAGRIGAATESYQSFMDKSGGNMSLDAFFTALRSQ